MKGLVRTGKLILDEIRINQVQKQYIEKRENKENERDQRCPIKGQNDRSLHQYLRDGKALYRLKSGRYDVTL